MQQGQAGWQPAEGRSALRLPCLSSGPAYGRGPTRPRLPHGEGPMAAHAVHAARSPVLRDRARCRRLQKISTWSGAAVLGDLEPLHQELGGTRCLWGLPEGRWGEAGGGVWGRGGQHRPPPGGASSAWGPGVAPNPGGEWEEPGGHVRRSRCSEGHLRGTRSGWLASGRGQGISPCLSAENRPNFTSHGHLQARPSP